MAEYIEREAAVKELDRKYGLLSGYHSQFYIGYQFAKKMMEQEPAADVAPVVHGRWNRPFLSGTKRKNPFCYCTNCAYPVQPKRRTKYCPNCGAKMDLEV